MGERNFRIDNIRGILSFLVIWGHILEIIPMKSEAIYQFIYLFHMPGFAFLSGLCWSKENVNKTLMKLGYLYVLFQTLYIFFQRSVLKKEAVLQYTVPYWLMWYLLALMMWSLLAKILKIEKRNGLFVLVCAVIIALLSGYDNNFGYYLSSSRMVVLFPFFCLAFGCSIAFLL